MRLNHKFLSYGLLCSIALVWSAEATDKSKPYINPQTIYPSGKTNEGGIGIPSEVTGQIESFLGEKDQAKHRFISKHFNEVYKQRELVSIDLSVSSFGKMKTQQIPKIFAQISKMKTLESIDFSGQPISDSVAVWFKGFPKLKSLMLAQCPRTTSGFIENFVMGFSKEPEPTNLEELSLSISSFDTSLEPFLLLTHSNFPKLTSLVIYGETYPTDKLCACIKGLKGLKLFGWEIRADDSTKDIVLALASLNSIEVVVIPNLKGQKNLDEIAQVFIPLKTLKRIQGPDKIMTDELMKKIKILQQNK